MKIAIQIRELVSSNVSNLVENATDAKKMLNLLRKQVEETIISLQGDLTKAQRRAERLAREADDLTASIDGWQDKAKVAMSHKREDLARAALLAKEDAKLQSVERAAEAKAAGAEANEMEDAIAQLEAKHREVIEQLADYAAPARPAGTNPLGGMFADRGSATERKLDHISRLEKRVTFATSKPATDDPVPASVEAELSKLEREANAEAALAALKASAKSAKMPAQKKRK